MFDLFFSNLQFFGLTSHLILSIILIALILTIAFLIYAYFLQAGSVYQPSKPESVKNMLDFVGATKKDKIIDLGSGDGRILVEAARRGIRAIGYELDPVLAVESRNKIRQAGLSNLATVKFKSFWGADFDEATIITLYLFPKYMNKLQSLLEKKLTHSVWLVSNRYQFPRKRYLKRKGALFLYRFP